MNVKRVRQKSRARRDTPQTVDKLVAMKGGNLFLDAVSLPSEVGAGGQIRGQIKVDNGAISINATDPDACVAGDNSIGYSYNAFVDVTGGGSNAFEDQCVKPSFAGTGTNYHSISARAPDTPGTYEISITLETTGSLQRGSTTRLITVTGDGDPNPDPGCTDDGDCPSGMICDESGRCVDDGSDGPGGGGTGPLLPCFVDPNNSCSGFETAGYTLAGLFVLLIIAQAAT